MKADLQIYEKICEANNTYHLFSCDDRVLVGLSGGADSVALLLALKRFFKGLNLFACHVNHMIRGAEADNDAAFASELCRKENIPFELVKADVPAYAEKNGISTELAARNIRYDAFEKICKKHGISVVATAHTASDNAETVLFNLTRGSALDGLCGIPPVRALSKEIKIVRPLLFVTRDDIERWLSFINQDFVTDSTNLSDDYTRNYFRHRIIPALKDVNPALEDSLKNTCTALKDIQIFIEKTANNSMTDDVGQLSELDECILKRVIIELYHAYAPDCLIESVHVCEIARLVKQSAGNTNFHGKAEICLPGKISAYIADGRLYFGPTIRKDTNSDTSPQKDAYNIRLKPGLTILDNTPFALYLAYNDSPEEYNIKPTDIAGVPSNYKLFDSAVLSACALSEGHIVAKSRQPGDKIKSGGMTRKLKQLFCRQKIPVELRQTLPVICDKDEIIYVPRIAVADSHKQAVCSPSRKLRLLVFSESSL